MGAPEGVADGRARDRLVAAVALHACAFAGHLALTGARPGVDAARYLAAAEAAAAAWRTAPLDGTATLLRSVAQLPGGFPHGLLGGPSTDTMVGLLTALHLLTGGSVAAITALVAAAAFGGRWALYRGLASFAPDRELAAFLAVFAVPSIGFWTTGLTKEALAVPCLGLVVLGLAERRPVGALGLVGLGLLRPQALLAVAAGSLALPDASPRARWLRVLAAALAVAVLAEVVPPIVGGWPLSDQIAWRRAASAVDDAASAVPLGPPPTGPVGWALLGLGALATGALRPGLWEAHRATAALAGAENALLVVALAAGLVRAPRALWGRAGVVFALVTAALLALGLGVTTTNLGTLSRYRALLVPLLWWVALAACLTPAPTPAPRATLSA